MTKQSGTPRWEKRLVRGLLLLLLAATIAGVAVVLSPPETIAQAPPPPPPPPVRGLTLEDEAIVTSEAETFLPRPAPLMTPLNEQVLTVAFSPDGKKLATAGAHGGIPGQFKIWDVAASKELVSVRRIPGVRTVAFSPDGQFVACGDFAGFIKLRDANTGLVRAQVKGHNFGVNGLAFSPDSHSLASAGLDQTVKIWDLKSLQESYQSLQSAEKGPGIELVGPDAANIVKFEPAGLRLTFPTGRTATNAGTGVVVAHAVKGDFEITVNFEILQEPEAENAGTQTRLSLAVNLNRPGANDQATLSRRMTANGPHFFSWAFVRNKETGKDRTIGKEFPTKAKTGRLRLVRTGTMLSYYVAEGPNAEFTFLQQYAFGAEDLKDVRLVVAPGGPTASLHVRFTDLRIRAEALPGMATTPGPLGLQERRVLRGHNGPVYTVAFAPDGQSVVSGGQDRVGRIWDVRTGTEKFKLPGHRSAVETVAVSPDGKTVATGSWDQSIKLWEMETGKEVGSLEGQDSSIYAVTFSPVDSNLLACATQGGTIRLWNVKERKWLRDLAGNRPYSLTAMSTLGLFGSVGQSGPLPAMSFLNAAEPYEYYPPLWALAFSPDGKYLASGGSDRTATVWDVAAAKEVTSLSTISPASNNVHALAYAPDGQMVAIAAGDNTVQMRDAKTGDVLFFLTGHENVVTCLAFSPDGQTVATGSADKTLKLWDRTTGQEKRTLKGHSAPVTALAFTADGRQLASGSDDQTVKLWETTSGKDLATFKGHEGAVKAVAFAPDGRNLFSAGADKTIKVWDPAKATDPPRTLKGHEGAIRALACSADGSLASAGEDATVRLWDVAQGKERRILTGHAGTVAALAFSPSGRTLVSGGFQQGIIIVWDSTTGQQRQAFHGHGTGITALAFDPQGVQLLSGGLNQTVRWQGADAAFPLRTLSGNAGGNRFAVFSPSGERLASGGEGGSVTLWSRTLTPARYPAASLPGNYSDIAFSPDGRTLVRIIGQSVTFCDALSGQVEHGVYVEKQVRSLAYSPDGKYLAISTGGNRPADNPGGLQQPEALSDIRLYEVATGQFTAVLPVLSETTFALRFSPDSKILATAGRDKSIQLWEVPSGKLLKTFNAHQTDSSALAFLPDGTLVSSSWDGSIRFWDTGAGQQKRLWMVGRVRVTSLAVSADGTLLACGDGDSPNPTFVHVWDIRAGKEIARLQGMIGRVKAITFTRDGQGLLAVGGRPNGINEITYWHVPTGRLLANFQTGGQPFNNVTVHPDGKRVAANSIQGIYFWDLDLLRPERTWSAHALPVSCALFVKNGQVLVTGSLDSSIKLWDVNKGELLTVLKEHSGAIRALAVLPDGNTLLSASDDKTIKLWDLTTFKEKTTLRSHTLPVSSLAVSGDGKTLASGGGDLDKPGAGEMLLWDLGTGTPRPVAGIDKAVWSVAYSSDGAWLTAGLATGVIQVWDAKTEKATKTLSAPQVRPLAYSPDGKFLAVGQGSGRTWLETGDGRVSLWNTATWQKRADLQKHADLVHSVAFSPDGWTLASASQDGTIKLCSLTPVRQAVVSPVAPAGNISIGDVMVKEVPMATVPIAVAPPIAFAPNPPNPAGNAPSNPAPSAVAAPPPPKPQPLAWLPMAEFIGMLLTLAVVTGIGLLIFLRSRPALALADDEPILDTPLPDDYDDEPILDTPYEEPEELPPISFPCAACGKKLKAKAELAGKKVKCKQCGKVIPVPSGNTNGIKEQSS